MGEKTYFFEPDNTETGGSRWVISWTAVLSAHLLLFWLLLLSRCRGSNGSALRSALPGRCWSCPPFELLDTTSEHPRDCHRIRKLHLRRSALQRLGVCDVSVLYEPAQADHLQMERAAIRTCQDHPRIRRFGTASLQLDYKHQYIADVTTMDRSFRTTVTCGD